MKPISIARVRLAAAFLAGMAMAPLALANGAVVKCIGPAGQVTFTDSTCQSGERSVTLIAASPAPVPAAAPPLEPVAGSDDSANASLAAPPSVARTVGMVQARMPARLARPALGRALGRYDSPSRSLGRDVLTLKAARQAMLLMDGATDALRNTRVAGLH